VNHSSVNPKPFLEPLGLPEFYDVSLPACHGLWTPADLHILAKTDASVLPSAHVKTLGVRNLHLEAVPALQGARPPRSLPRTRSGGLQDSLPTLSPSCSLLKISSNSAMDPRLDTGGWLTLTESHYCLSSRQGLSPCKIRRACLGAITQSCGAARSSPSSPATCSPKVYQGHGLFICISFSFFAFSLSIQIAV
jgi:hypothetical protein